MCFWQSWKWIFCWKAFFFGICPLMFIQNSKFKMYVWRLKNDFLREPLCSMHFLLRIILSNSVLAPQMAIQESCLLFIGKGYSGFLQAEDLHGWWIQLELVLVGSFCTLQVWQRYFLKKNDVLEKANQTFISEKMFGPSIYSIRFQKVYTPEI